MKKIITVIAIIVVSFAVLSRCAVESPESDIDYKDIEIVNVTENEEDTKDENEEKYSFEYSDIHFTHSPNDLVKVSITYPQFKDEKLSTLNTKIEEFAKSNFIEIISEEDVDNLELTLEETYSVKLANEGIVSISSTGELTRKDAPYPTVLKNSLNIHPKDYRKFKINELINIDNGFVQLFKETSSSDEQLATYLSSFSDEEIAEKILDSKMYFDDEDVVIIFSVPHAIGDYFEVKFEKAVIEPYM